MVEDTEKNTSNNRERLHMRDVDVPTAPHISRQMGDAAASRDDDYNDEHYTYHPNDGRSPNRTYFEQNDDPINPKGPPQAHRKPRNRRTWGTLAQWNDGVGDPGRSVANHAAFRRRTAAAIGDGVGLTRHERHELVRRIDDIDVRRFGVPHTPTIEQTIVALASLVRDQHAIDDAQRIVNNDTFAKVCEAEELSEEKLSRLRAQIVDRTDQFREEILANYA